VLLKTGKDNAAATALMAYLQSDTARAIIRAYGYDL
jgi:molybdate transport system substrate-binding protein